MFKKSIYVLFLFIFISNPKILSSQSKDSLSQVGFAEFLEKGELYKFAAEEYERLFFTYPNEKSFFSGLMRNYRKSGNLDLLSRRFESTNSISKEALTYYTLGLIDNKQYEDAENIISINQGILSDPFEKRIRTDIILLKGDYKSAEEKYYANSIEDSNYLQLIKDGQKIKRKSPLLAGLMSSIIPGTGRFYSGDYADGIISLLFIGTTAYQAYSRFKKKGSKSVAGWIYGGISLGFHLGNIYGSVQSAKYYNSQKQKAHNAKVKSYIDMYYSDF